MFFEILIIAVVLLIVYSIYRSYWGQDKNTAVVASSSENKEPGVATKTGNWFSNTFSNLKQKVSGGKKEPKLSQQFQSWAAETLNKEKDLQKWLTSLSDEGIQSLTDQLADFCASLNLNLAWLVSKRLDQDPDLRKVAEDVVVAYCKACWNAAEAQDELQVFKTYVNLKENPNSKENKQLSQKIFAELVNRDLASPASPELFLAGDSDRQQHVMQTINQVADRDRKAFNKVLREVIEIKAESAPAAEEPKATNVKKQEAASAAAA